MAATALAQCLLILKNEEKVACVRLEATGGQSMIDVATKLEIEMLCLLCLTTNIFYWYKLYRMHSRFQFT